MKKLNNTIVSSTPPSDKNSMWYDGKTLYIYSNGKWQPVSGSISTDILNKPV
jgi:hypothetical protein